MRLWSVCLLIVAVAAASVGCGSSPHAYNFFSRSAKPKQVVHNSDYRVMSFNLRTKFVGDGPNYWDHRKEYVVQSIQKFSPDLLGTQECQASQARYLKAHLPGYEFVGAGRNDGKGDGEMCGIFYRSDKFTKLDQGHFWLSETPYEPGSKSWGSSYRRMVSWVKLIPRSGGEPFYFFNTHLDNSSERARVQQAWLLRRMIDQIADGRSTIVTGDFNTGYETTPYQLLVHGPQDWRGYLVDTYSQVNKVTGHGEGTRHKFHGGTDGDRIDWIMTTDNFTTVSATIDRTHYGGRYPSDHFPVTAVVRQQQGSRFAGHRSSYYAGGS